MEILSTKRGRSGAGEGLEGGRISTKQRGRREKIFF